MRVADECATQVDYDIDEGLGGQEESKLGTGALLSASKEHSARIVQTESKKHPASRSALQTPARQFSPKLMDKRGAPLPKKSKQPNRGGASKHPNNTMNSKKTDPIVVVESHKKFIQQKENEVRKRSSARHNSLIQFQ